MGGIWGTAARSVVVTSQSNKVCVGVSYDLHYLIVKHNLDLLFITKKKKKDMGNLSLYNMGPISEHSVTTHRRQHGSPN